MSPLINRRELLRQQLTMAAGAGLFPALASPARAEASSSFGKAKSVIFLYLHGGAPSQDMFDMKPKAPREIRGEFNPIATNVPGIEICEHLPGMARWMHRSAVLRAVLTTDFGRTPGVNPTAGRDHWIHCYSTVLAGAGVRGGTVYGASDAHAAWPVNGPVRPADICATIYQQLGMDPDTIVHDRTARPHKIAQGGEPIRRILT